MFYEKVVASANYIKTKITQTPTIGLILGSGLGGVVDALDKKEIVPYADIPDFPQSHVAGPRRKPRGWSNRRAYHCCNARSCSFL